MPGTPSRRDVLLGGAAASVVAGALNIPAPLTKEGGWLEHALMKAGTGPIWRPMLKTQVDPTWLTHEPLLRNGAW